MLLVVSGGIAAYKSILVARELGRAGAVVDVVLTRSAQRFVGPVTFEALTGRPVHVSLWKKPLAHIELGREADVAVVAPATADTLAGLALGLASDLAGATLLAAACPLLVAPAMNRRMWEHPATQHHARVLSERGVRLVGPATGELAEGEWGPGRMAEPGAIVAEMGRLLEAPSPLRDRRVVVTAGPTRAAIDAVRYLGNRSSGRMGYALAASAWRRGADTVLISGPGTVPPPYGPRTVEVENSWQMLDALRDELQEGSLLLMAAAVSDYEAAAPVAGKIRREEAERLSLELVRGPDLLAETRDERRRLGVFTLGFALETEDGARRARRKLEAKGLDLIALNEVGRPDAGFDAPTNRVAVFDRSGEVARIPLLAKSEVADLLLDRVEERLSG